MELLIGEVFLKAAILCGLLYAIARHEADYSFSKVAMVTAGLMLGSVLIDATVKPHLGPWTAIVHVAFIAFMIMTFCWITFWKSLIVVAVYSAVHFIIALLAAMLLGYLSHESGKSGMVTMGATESEFKEIQDEINKNFALAAGQAGGDSIDSPAHETGRDGRAAAPSSAAASATSAPPAKVWNPPVDLPKAVAVGDESEGWTAARRLLTIGGTISGAGGSPMVRIEGQLREAGDFVTARSTNAIYRWRIESIAEDGIRLQPVDVRPAPAQPAAPPPREKRTTKPEGLRR